MVERELMHYFFIRISASVTRMTVIPTQDASINYAALQKNKNEITKFDAFAAKSLHNLFYAFSIPMFSLLGALIEIALVATLACPWEFTSRITQRHFAVQLTGHTSGSGA